MRKHLSRHNSTNSEDNFPNLENSYFVTILTSKGLLMSILCCQKPSRIYKISLIFFINGRPFIHVIKNTRHNGRGMRPLTPWHGLTPYDGLTPSGNTSHKKTTGAFFKGWLKKISKELCQFFRGEGGGVPSPKCIIGKSQNVIY